uniref:Uncharacterized protein n=1 Tax=Anguilla anguilla TaxID=7936 RepID=A0A0E9URK3_ANGAN
MKNQRIREMHYYLTKICTRFAFQMFQTQVPGSTWSREILYKYK